MPYIEVLAQRHEVAVIVPAFTTVSREAMGWGKYESEAPIRLLVAPADKEVRALFEEPYEGRTVALFSGITAFQEVKAWLDLSLLYEVERGVITEAPYTFKYPLWMHEVRFLLKDYKYIKYIKYVFAIGPGCRDYFQGWSSRWKVVPFAYCVSGAVEPVETGVQLPANQANLCFVGSLDKRKNVMVLLKAFHLFKHKHLSAAQQCHLTVVGEGPCRKDLENFVETHHLSEQVSFVGTLPMPEARQLIAQCQALVLPSLYDGWGAVVNEALTAGTMVYCSTACGASSLLEDPSMGRVFKPTDAQTLARFFWNDYGFFLDQKKMQYRRSVLKQWAQEHIGPEAMAQRMENALVKRR